MACLIREQLVLYWQLQRSFLVCLVLCVSIFKRHEAESLHTRRSQGSMAFLPLLE